MGRLDREIKIINTITIRNTGVIVEMINEQNIPNLKE